MANRLLQHVNVAYPPGAEAEARAFYAGTLGLDEVPKPVEFDRDGLWFQLDGAGQVHLAPRARRAADVAAHFCVVVDDFEALRRRVEASGAPVEESHGWAGHRRLFTRDPWGNLIELLEGPAPNL